MFGQKKKLANRASRVAKRSGKLRARSSQSAFRIPPSAFRNPHRSRRGVLLLVVLSLLVLFLMVGTAFIVATKQTEKASKAYNRAALSDASETARGNLLDEVLRQVVRDTANPASVLRTHSLLADMYGLDGFRCVISDVQWAAPPPATGGPSGPPTAGGATADNGGVTRGQLIQFDVSGAVDLYRQPYQLSSLDGAYNGQVVTFVTPGQPASGAAASAKGVSTRIVGYRPTGPNMGAFTVMAFPLADGSTATQAVLSQLVGSQILVNGRPFNGTGAGYNPSPRSTEDAPLLDAKEGVGGNLYELALLPNAAYFLPQNVVLTGEGVSTPAQPNAYFGDQNSFTDYAGRGGPDESYDAADFQNMLLALLSQDDSDNPNDIDAQPDDKQNPGATLDRMILPSLHRPELINHMYERFEAGGGDPLMSDAAASRLLLRRIWLRPNPLDHPLFTGSTREYEASLIQYVNDPDNQDNQNDMLARAIFGPWDVDNDNDGTRDSIWVDFGAPVMLGPHGKLVKPLAAILCVDLDGRINLNTAGTLDTTGIAPDPTSPPNVALAEGMPPQATPRGMGWGAAEISAEAALGGQSFRYLSAGQPAIAGKYGMDRGPGHSNRGNNGPAVFDAMAQVNLFGWPQWGGRGTQLTQFTLPPDLRARYGNGLNDYGQLVIEATFNSEGLPGGSGALLADSPYELDLYGEGSDGQAGVQAVDAPFSVAELEKLLRAYDIDATVLPDRLARLGGGRDPRERNRITTDSWDVPMPMITLTHEMEPMVVAGGTINPLTNHPYRRLPQSTAELYEIRVRHALGYPKFPEPLDGDVNDPNSQAGRVRTIVRQLLAPELAAGGKLNVNRPLGNGRDDNNNGVVDEPGEDLVSSLKRVWQRSPDPLAAADQIPPNFDAVDFAPLDVNHDGQIDDSDALLQRQLLARHLYVLELVNTAPTTFGAAGATQAADRRLAARAAQWAINAVDFRDADNIMTPFEYDLNPFDGWEPDGDLNTTADHAGPDNSPNTADDTVVWGTERPELVISEVIAWHDRNTTDEADEDPNPGEQPGDSSDPLNEPGEEFDQLYRPRGAFFLELYNPWPANPAGSTDVHRIVGGNDLGIDLQQLDRETGTTPVWRLVFYRDPDVTKDPDDPNPGNRPGNVERSIYFGGFDPADGDTTRGIQPVQGWNDAEDGTAFYNDYADLNARDIPPVRPGRYMVVGSGTEEVPGSGIYTSQFGQRLDQLPSDRPRKPLRSIQMNTRPTLASPPIKLVDNASGPGSTGIVTPVQNEGAMPFPMEPPTETAALSDPNARFSALPGDNNSLYITDIAVINSPRRFTISEPDNGYPHSVGNVAWVPKERIPRGTNRDPSEDGYYATGDGRDQNGRPIGDPNRPKAIDTPLDNGDPALMTIGATYNHRQVFLQRLANPLIPWNPPAGQPGHDANRPVNIYRTVDRAVCNLSVFNGRLGATQQENGARNSELREGFSSLERGFRGSWQNGGRQDYNLWSIQPLDHPSRMDDERRRAGIRVNDNNFSLRTVPPVTLGFLNRSYMDNNAQSDVEKRVRPDDPFPWLAWNNRPYVSGNELMLVPRVRSSMLLGAFMMADDDNQSPYDTPVDDAIAAQQQDPRQPRDGNDYPPFFHLENFLYDEESSGANPPNSQPSHLYRMLEFVETPSLFVGASTWLNPLIYTPPGTLTATRQPGDPLLNLLPPLNRVSNFRDPGKVNLNTVFSASVYGGLFHGDEVGAGDVRPEAGGNVHPGPRWDADEDSFIRSRRGYGGGNDDMLALNGAWPTFFANPLRAPGAAQYVPLANMVRKGVEATLLRSTSASPGQVDDFPLLFAGTNQDHNDAERSAFFRYAPITRLDNLVTQRSNVYAVWVTIGFFEVQPAPAWADVDQDAFANDITIYNRVYADGYTYGRESGLDEGDVRRLRGFSIIDRTRPAGFEPGADHNIEKTIRLRRRIE